jgi:hypothetical protein
MHSVVRGTGTPKDRDEVNKRDARYCTNSILQQLEKKLLKNADASFRISSMTNLLGTGNLNLFSFPRNSELPDSCGILGCVPVRDGTVFLFQRSNGNASTGAGRMRSWKARSECEYNHDTEILAVNM